MLNTAKKQHIAALVMLSLTALVWGAGFVLNDQLLKTTFTQTPILLNAIRFGVSAIVFPLIFWKKIKWNKQTFAYGAIGGVFLFVAFHLQLTGLNLSTPAHSGFFTAAYVVFVPFIAWAMFKKRPCVWTLVGVGVAIVGLALLNFDGGAVEFTDTLGGDMITLASAFLFSLQIVWSEISLKKVDLYSFTTVQVGTAAILFVAATLIFESGNYSNLTMDPSYGIWRLITVTLGGTAFAYFAQTYSQQHLSSSETALIMGCESPVGAVLSLIAGIDVFSWNMLAGGLMVIAAVVLVEVLPTLGKKKTAGSNVAPTATTDDVKMPGDNKAALSSDNPSGNPSDNYTATENAENQSC